MNNRTDLPKNPLRRAGVSQRQRLTPALAPDQPQAAQVDERTLADFLVLAYRLSQQVNYYKVPERGASVPLANRLVEGRSVDNRLGDNGLGNNRLENRPAIDSTSNSLASLQDGDWQAFFTDYAPVQIALISKLRPQSVKHDYDKLLETFLKQPDETTLAPILHFWRACILKPIQTWYQTLDTYPPFRSIIKGLVNTNLGAPVNQIVAFEQAFPSEENTVFYEELIALFQLPPALASGSHVAGTSIGIDSQNELDGIFQALFQVYRQIVHQASTFLEDSLRDRRDHPPHLALYVAMLDVLQPARDDLNRMTQRHLDFFYRKVLKLPARPAVPDYAHLLFELAKPQQDYKLAAGTRFKAGKDDTGVELFYALDRDMVVHRASITSLKGLFLASQQFPNEKPTDLVQLLASPVANSFDGKGEAFPKEQAVKAWLPFGGPRVPTSQTAQLDILQTPQGMPAELGVAIASDVLLLQEGDRTITLEFSLGNVFKSPENVDNLENAFEIYLSGEKEWIVAKADDAPARIKSVEWIETDSTLEIVVGLTAEVDPILPYDTKNPIPFDPEIPNLPLTLERPIPVLRLQLTANSLDEQGRSAYHYFRNVTLSDLTVTVQVPEVRNLVIQTDAGVQDITKPFQPFGPRPKTGSILYIGSQEIFQKTLSELTLAVEWEDLPDGGDFAAHYKGYYIDNECVVDGKNGEGCQHKADDYFNNFSVTVDRRTKRTWSGEALEASFNLFDPLQNNTSIQRALLQEPMSGEALEPFTTFTADATGGFLRFVLDRSFLKDEFPIKFATQTLATAKNFQDNDFVNDAVYEVFSESSSLRRYTLQSSRDFPKNSDSETVVPVTLKEPYTPVIRSLYFGYEAQAKLAEVQAFRLYPFGGFEPFLPQNTPTLFPQFTYEGELLIGITDLEPPTALPLLFQVAEETADTGLRRTEAFKPAWFYLKDNTWVPLSDRISSDTTNGLTRSGIVNLGIPEEISKINTTILDPTLHWVKVVMPARTRTVCHIIGVHSQAARVTFVTGGNNDPNYLATPLPAGSIAKLEKPQAEIKSIEQPYPSVEGRIKEPPSQFYTRVSEHLRHKGRAVTIFDYERLVLEQFPDIYKVRCLNHGQFDDATNALFELSPGSVTVAVIPDLSQRSTTDDLQPKVNINRLQTIETYLGSLSSSWAALKVVNPQYEPIRVSFEVKFRSPYDANFGYYRRELERAIVGFLTPWTVDQGADIHFGGKVYHSAILNFVEEQEYVDYVVNFSMFHNGEDNLLAAIASTARSVLTSVPYNHPTGHIIEELKEQTLVVPTVPLAAGILGYEPLDNLVIGPEDP